MDMDITGKKIKYYTLDGQNGVGRVIDIDDEVIKVSRVLEEASDDNFMLIFRRALVRIEFLRDVPGSF